jgi:hypothetical protein
MVEADGQVLELQGRKPTFVRLGRHRTHAPLRAHDGRAETTWLGHLSMRIATIARAERRVGRFSADIAHQGG